MAKPLSILYVSSEVFPFAKIGGVGDIAYSLPLAIRDAGHDIRVILPKYGIVSERKNRIHDINRLRDLPIPIGQETRLATVKSSSIYNTRTKVQAYIATNQDYFDSRKGIYGEPGSGADYFENDERFMFFCRTAIETCLVLNWFPDVIHCNDWQTALTAAFARILFPGKFKKTRFILTIHNFARQGEFPAETFDKLDLPENVRENFIHNGKVNFLKAGIVYSDYVNTVSKTYADEVLEGTDFSNGLNEVLKEKNKFCGILNGIDDLTWNPKTDPYLFKKLTDDFEEYKEINKRNLADKLGFEYKSKTPLVGLVTNLADHKGVDLLFRVIPLLADLGMQFVLLGDGEQKYIHEVKELYKIYYDNFAFKIGNDENLAHNIEAACDMYLMPSLSEPCGLNAMYSMMYGTVPVVRSTGGLGEIVRDYDPENKTGNGFTFKEYTPEALMDAIERAFDIYGKRSEWLDLAKGMMKEDFSWKESVKRYIQIYQNSVKDAN